MARTVVREGNPGSQGRASRTEEDERWRELRRFVGIDVAKAVLDVFIGPIGEAFSVANDEVASGNY
jgi:hypothetical protein